MQARVEGAKELGKFDILRFEDVIQQLSGQRTPKASSKETGMRVESNIHNQAHLYARQLFNTF